MAPSKSLSNYGHWRSHRCPYVTSRMAPLGLWSRQPGKKKGWLGDSGLWKVSPKFLVSDTNGGCSQLAPGGRQKQRRMGFEVIKAGGGGWSSGKDYNQLGTGFLISLWTQGHLRMWLKGLLSTLNQWGLGSFPSWQHQWSAGGHVASPSPWL